MEPTGFWFNPNIHPYKEYQARKDTLVEYAAKIGLKLIEKEIPNVPREKTREILEYHLKEIEDGQRDFRF